MRPSVMAEEVVVSRESEMIDFRDDLGKLHAEVDAFKVSMQKDMDKQMLQVEATMAERINSAVMEKTSALEEQLSLLADAVGELADEVGKASHKHHRGSEQSKDLAPMAVVPGELRSSRMSTLNWKSARARLDDLKCYELRGTIWDIPFYLGMKAFRTSDEFIVYLVFIINVVIQVAFIVLVNAKMVDGDFNHDGVVQNLLDWRVMYAHDPKYADAFTNAPLADSVCALSTINMEGTLQATLYGDVHSYLEDAGGFASGELLCILACCLWVFACARECENALRLLSGLWTTAYQSGRSELTGLRRLLSARSFVKFLEAEMVTVDDGDVASKSVKLSCSFSRAMMCTVFVVIPRIMITLVLGFVGARFLVAYIQLSEFILNSVALEVVLGVDELLFDIFVPYIPKMILAKTFPLHRSRTSKAMAGILPYVKITVTFTCILLIRLVLLSPIIDNIKEVKRVMCDGSIEFVAAEISIGSVFAGVPQTKETINRNRYSYLSILQRTGLQESSRAGSKTLYLDSRLPPETSLFPIPNVFQARVYQDLTVGSIALSASDKPYTVRCDSDTFWSTGFPFVRNAVSQLLEEVFAPHPANCTIIKSQGYCYKKSKHGTTARFFCPKTCGLSEPQSGNAFFGGDEGVPARDCERTIGMALMSVKCEDLQQGHPAFEALALSLPNLLHDAFARFGNASYSAQALANLAGMLRLGCQYAAQNPDLLVTSINEGKSYPIVQIACSPQALSAFGYHVRGLRLLCPITCGCLTVAQQYFQDGRAWTSEIGNYEHCPKACFNYTLTSGR